jgi:hypothetical protein
MMRLSLLQVLLLSTLAISLPTQEYRGRIQGSVTDST